ncbi:MAG: DUF952 domain-containing protein [Chitinophagaceae bacterium]|nr:MAG: DUF952 domain-containing protein [Chitinophagaceae bacterium]
MIYHVTTNAAWTAAKERGRYEHPSLEQEGFIHNCSREQLAGVLDRYYKNTGDLLLLHINEQLLEAELKYELAASVNEEFPHVFGPINMDAVVNTEAL